MAQLPLIYDTVAGTISASSIASTSRTFNDDVPLGFGTGTVVKFEYDTVDPNANHLKVDLPTGGAVDVPVVAVGIGIVDVGQGLFNGFTQPYVALFDADRDSVVGFHYSADDVGVVRMQLAAGTVRNHTIPNVASDAFTLNDATQTLTAKTLTSPTITTSPTAVGATWTDLGAVTALGVAAGTTTWTGQSISFTGANSTNNTTLTVTNSSNAAAASHSIVDIAVGGTTSTGDPQLRLTIPSGTSYYVGVDNSNSDILDIGTGTTVGSTRLLSLAGAGGSAVFNDDGADIDFRIESDTSANMFEVNAGANGGYGAIRLGGGSLDSLRVVQIGRGSLTISSGGAFATVFIHGGSNLTLDAAMTTVESLRIEEPQIGIGTGSVTDAITLFVVDAATEATRNWAAVLGGRVGIGTDPTAITHDLNTTGRVDFNAQGADIDFRVQSDTQQNMFEVDAGRNGGYGSVRMGGGSIDTNRIVQIGRSGLIVSAGSTFATMFVHGGSNLTVDTVTLTTLASLRIEEPQINIGTGAVTDAMTFFVVDAPTEGTRNWAAVLGGRVGIGTAPTAITHDLNTDTIVVFNEQAADIDFRIESDTNANAILLDAGLFSGVGQVSIGAAAQGTATAFLVLDNPAITATSNQNFYKALITNSAAVTVTGATTSALVASLALDEPNITATGTVTASAALAINSVATEATTNYAIYVAVAASTTNQYSLFQNTSNAAAASHSIVDVAVGGTTSTGDPQMRLTVPGGTSWYIGADNSETGDNFIIGTGTTVGSLRYITIDPRTTSASVSTFSFGSPNFTLASDAGAVVRLWDFVSPNISYTGATQVTSLLRLMNIGSPSITSDTATLTIDKATALAISAPSDFTNVTITDSSSLRILNTATLAGAQHGLYIEDLTGGATDYGIFIAGADTAAIWVNSADPIHVGLAGTATGKMEWSGATSGTVTVTVAAVAGTWTMTLPTGVAGTAGFQLTDAAADGITSWSGAGSRREWKTIYGPHDARIALAEILRTPVYDFQYRQDAPSTGDLATLYTGPMADEAPWAMHYGKSIVNPVNTLGYMILGFQAQDARIAALEEALPKWSTLEERVQALERANDVLKRQLVAAGIVPEV